MESAKHGWLRAISGTVIISNDSDCIWLKAHIDEPQVYSNNMDTDELDQLLDEFEDVFVKAGEDGSQLNMESMMDKMNGNNGTLTFLSDIKN